MKDIYPVPVAPPVYQASKQKVRADGGSTLSKLVSMAILILGSLLTLWYAWLLFANRATLGLGGLVALVLLWGVVAYLALPRMHQLLSSVYVPDYFISRTRTQDGLLGDPVNLAVDGQEVDIHAAMQRANWTLADEIDLKSSLRIIYSSVFRKTYAQAPVSPLFLFGKRHAFAYQQEVDGNAAQRHHVRFWRTPPGWRLPGGEAVDWLAAGTYDRAVGFSAFTAQVTHKIDADIDRERDYIIDTIRYADPACAVRVIEGFSIAYHARNGGGDMVKTDGNLPILEVNGALRRFKGPVQQPMPSPPPSVPLSLVFASVLCVLQIAALAIVWLALAQLGFQVVLAEGMTVRNLVVTTVLVGFILLGLILTWWRLSVGRLTLLFVLSLSGVLELSAVANSEQGSPYTLLMAGMSVMLLWALSGEKLRRWVER